MASDLWTIWWVWFAAALVLAVLEVTIPGYLFLGFAIGAAVLGLSLVTGLWMPSLALALVLFAVFSLAAYVILRKMFKLRTGQVKLWDRDINE